MSAVARRVTAPAPAVTWLTHSRVQLALHCLRPAPTDHTAATTHPLLLLHGLGEASGATVPAYAADWPGAVHALDFTGHGRSTVPAGGGYSAEILLADADAALAELAGDAGSVTIVGRGLGGYVALLLAGARAAQVHGAVVCDGPGLTGGAIGPTSQAFVALSPRELPPDPYALFELSRDLRPPDYATLFVRLAVEGSGLDEPIAVAAIVHPPWLAAVVGEVGVGTATVREALAGFAGTPTAAPRPEPGEVGTRIPPDE